MSNKQNDHFQETAYEAHLEDMRVYALENQVEELQEIVKGLRLDYRANKISIIALNRTIKIQSKRIDRTIKAL